MYNISYNKFTRHQWWIQKISLDTIQMWSRTPRPTFVKFSAKARKVISNDMVIKKSGKMETGSTYVWYLIYFRRNKLVHTSIELENPRTNYWQILGPPGPKLYFFHFRALFRKKWSKFVPSIWEILNLPLHMLFWIFIEDYKLKMMFFRNRIICWVMSQATLSGNLLSDLILKDRKGMPL